MSDKDNRLKANITIKFGNLNGCSMYGFKLNCNPLPFNGIANQTTMTTQNQLTHDITGLTKNQAYSISIQAIGTYDALSKSIQTMGQASNSISFLATTNYSIINKVVQVGNNLMSYQVVPFTGTTSINTTGIQLRDVYYCCVGGGGNGGGADSRTGGGGGGGGVTFNGNLWPDKPRGELLESDIYQIVVGGPGQKSSISSSKRQICYADGGGNGGTHKGKGGSGGGGGGWGGALGGGGGNGGNAGGTDYDGKKQGCCRGSDGGKGRFWLINNTVYGGGGAGGSIDDNTGGNGGAGGGANGGSGRGSGGGNASPGTGGGGGGGGYNAGGGSGASGIVLLAIPLYSIEQCPSTTSNFYISKIAPSHTTLETIKTNPFTLNKNIKYYASSLEDSQQNCANKCDADSNCSGFFYSGNQVVDGKNCFITSTPSSSQKMQNSQTLTSNSQSNTIYCSKN